MFSKKETPENIAKTITFAKDARDHPISLICSGDPQIPNVRFYGRGPSCGPASQGCPKGRTFQGTTALTVEGGISDATRRYVEEAKCANA